MNNKISNLFEQSTSLYEGIFLPAISDLELLIERHTQNRYDEIDYGILFTNPELFELRMENNEADCIVYFLHFLLYNFPDRAAATALALSKCYTYNIEISLVNALKVYEKSHDRITLNLCKAILDPLSRGLMDVKPESLLILKKLAKQGLPETREFLEDEFELVESMD